VLSSIHPFGERARNQRYWITASAFVIGATAGGLALGGAVAAISMLFSGLRPEPATILSMAALLIAAGWESTGATLPSYARQVDEKWLMRYRGWVYGVGFGFQLGVGFATYVRSALTYGFVLAGALLGRPDIALAAGLAFGLTRGLSILFTARAKSPEMLRTKFQSLETWRLPTRTISSVGTLILALYAAIGPL
jgi:hypothetical protein